MRTSPFGIDPIFRLQALEQWRGELAAGDPTAHRAARTLVDVLRCGTLDPGFERHVPPDGAGDRRRSSEVDPALTTTVPTTAGEHAVDRLRWLERWQAEIDAGEPAAQVAAQVLFDILWPVESDKAPAAGNRRLAAARSRQPRHLVTSERPQR